MAVALARKLKDTSLTLGGVEFNSQCKNWVLNNDTGDGETKYTFAPDGAFVDPADDAYSIDLQFYADWRSNGISDFLTSRDGQTVTYQIDHLVNFVGERARFNGSVLIKAPSVGGDIRATEETVVKLICTGKPVYTRP